jgi:hypothetical protein
MTDGYTFNRVNFTKDEETCILKFLRQAVHPECDKQWHPVINSIIQKYYNSDIKEAQEFQTR